MINKKKVPIPGCVGLDLTANRDGITIDLGNCSPAEIDKLEAAFREVDGIVTVLSGSFVRPFLIDETPVTVAEWRQAVAAQIGDEPYQINCSSIPVHLDESAPIVYVSWFDVLAFCNIRSVLAGLPPYYKLTVENGEVVEVEGNEAAIEKGSYRLPSEEEWYHAARGGVDQDPYGPLDDIAWHDGNIPERKAQPVGQRQPNAYGLYDVIGNVWEWI